MLTHLDLFSGIGGFALAAEWAGFRTIGFAEIDTYCQNVLKKHWPDVPITEDVRNVSRTSVTEPVTLITGGFPCQPFSVTGKRRGKEDNRYLWPAMCRVIEELKPHWVLGENVAGIINMELDTVLSDLERISYTTQTFIIPACAVNAPHRRDRVWIMAHYSNNGRPRPFIPISERRPEQENLDSCWKRKDVAIPTSRESRQQAKQEGGQGSSRRSQEVIANTTAERLQGVLYASGKQGPESKYQQLDGCSGIPSGGQWALEPELGRVAHGIPNRVDRLKCLGNAIVPQVAYQIIRVIAEIEGGQN